MSDGPPILLVESESEALHVLPRFIARRGPVVTATSIAAARDHISTHRPDVLVVDPDLPDGDGLTLVSEARERVPWAQTLVVCSVERSTDTARFIAAGAADVVIKPFDAVALPTRLDHLKQAAFDRKADLARTRELEAKLRHLDRVAMLGTLFATVAHEIASPLTAITTDVGLIREMLQTSSMADHERREIDSVLQEVGVSARAIEAFVARVRQFSRRDEGCPVVEPLSRPVETALVFLRPKISMSGVVVAHERADSAPVVPHVSTRITQAVANAVSNAIEASAPGGNVTVRYEESESEAGIIVEDDGPGLPEEMRKQITEPFFTTKANGTGLGMSVMLDVVRAHQGRLELLAGPGDKGLSVRMYLPKVL